MNNDFYVRVLNKESGNWDLIASEALPYSSLRSARLNALLIIAYGNSDSTIGVIDSAGNVVYTARVIENEFVNNGENDG